MFYRQKTAADGGESVREAKNVDFVSLDKNILDYEGEELKNIGDTKILNSCFEGEKVFSAQ